MNEIWNKIMDLLQRMDRRLLYLFILGMLFAALFAIPLNMTACVLPVLIIAVIIGLASIWKGPGFNLSDTIALISGGMIINLLTLI